jgi:hypothetical protein
MLLFVSLLRVLSNLCGRQSQPDVYVPKLTFVRRLKMGLVLATEGELCQTKRALVADGVSKVMVSRWGRWMMGGGQMMVQLGRGPITYPTAQLFGS